MTYQQFDAAKPDPETQGIVQMGDSERANLCALRDMILTGHAHGWTETPNYDGTLTYRLLSILMSKGAERLAVVFTYATSGPDTGRPITATTTYSADYSVTWATVETESIAWTTDGRWNGTTPV